MNKRFRYALGGAGVLIAVAALTLIAANGTTAVLDTKGLIADQQRDLIYLAVGLMALIIIPVFGLTFYIAWKYRANNKAGQRRYAPDLDGNTKLEVIWWGFPTLIIAILSVIIWQTSHSLDPFRPLASTNGQPALKVQVIALQWKWLFIYPEQGIASVNQLQIPVGRPVDFSITADAPMNSFWIPQLGGQVYAMSGMTTKLHLQADQPGTYRGSSANLSGEGFADMRFVAVADDQASFDRWVSDIRAAGNQLNHQVYDQLAQPSSSTPYTTYMLADDNLHNAVLAKYGSHGNYSHPAGQGNHTTGPPQPPNQTGKSQASQPANRTTDQPSTNNQTNGPAGHHH